MGANKPEGWRKIARRMDVDDATARRVAREKRPPRGFMVYAYVPVNVRVIAKSAKAAERFALRALNRSRPLELSSDDNATYQEMYIDGGTPAILDAQSVTVDDLDLKDESVTYVNEQARRAKPSDVCVCAPGGEEGSVCGKMHGHRAPSGFSLWSHYPSVDIAVQRRRAYGRRDDVIRLEPEGWALYGRSA